MLFRSVNQLETELSKKSWIVTENRLKSEIFKKPSNDFWKDQISDLGGDYLIWSNAPENPNLN